MNIKLRRVTRKKIDKKKWKVKFHYNAFVLDEETKETSDNNQ